MLKLFGELVDHGLVAFAVCLGDQRPELALAALQGAAFEGAEGVVDGEGEAFALGGFRLQEDTG